MDINGQNCLLCGIVLDFDEKYLFITPFKERKKMNQLDMRFVRSKTSIREAFFALMGEIGYYNITVKAISERANINRKTFYNHYESIDALYKDVLQTQIDALLKDIPIGSFNDTSYDSESEFLYQKIKTLFHNLSSNMNLMQILINDSSSHQLTKKLSEQILQKIFNKAAEKYLKKKNLDVPLDLLSDSIEGIFIAVIKWYIKNHSTYSEEEAAQIALKLISKELL